MNTLGLGNTLHSFIVYDVQYRNIECLKSILNINGLFFSTESLRPNVSTMDMNYILIMKLVLQNNILIHSS